MNSPDIRRGGGVKEVGGGEGEGGRIPRRHGHEEYSMVKGYTD